MSALNLAWFDGLGTGSLSVIGGLLAGLVLGGVLRPKQEETERSRPLVFLVALVVLIAASLGIRYGADHVLRRDAGFPSTPPAITIPQFGNWRPRCGKNQVTSMPKQFSAKPTCTSMNTIEPGRP